MQHAEIERLLTQVIGLDPATLGKTATGRAVQERLGVCEIADANLYCDRVRTSPTELQALIEAVVVSETWFFRDPAAFAALAREAANRHHALPAGQRLRLLSVPCSTGEEPYSMAMTLLDAGVPAQAFHIDAIDVSGRALTLAREGVYGRNSFRGAQRAGHARYFNPVADGFRIVDSIRALVSFKQGNLLEPSSLPQSVPYDIIFCRNVLIYFDAAAQDRAVSLLSRLLGRDGLMFVGAAETPVVRKRNCLPAAGGQAFTAGGTPPAPRRPASSSVSARTTSGSRVNSRPAPRAAFVAQIPAASRPAVAPPAPAEMLDEAMQLANTAQFTEAATVCERYLSEHGPSARAFCLIGLVRDAVGDRAGAAASYRKALYLDPQHEETLVHLALLLEFDHQGAEAGRLRARARRAAQTMEAGS